MTGVQTCALPISDETFVVDPARLFHRHRLTPYAGMSLSGVVRRTWLRGVPVTGEQPGGRLLASAMARR